MIQLFFNIIETTLEFSIIISILFMAMHLIGKKFTAKCRYIIWALIFIRLAIPFGPFSGMAFFTLELPITESSITQNTIFSSNNNWDSIVSNNSTPNVINTTDNLDKANAQPNQQAIVNSNVVNGINLSNDSSSSTLTNSSQSTGFFEIYGAFILSILILIWAAVAIVYFLWHLTIYLVLYSSSIYSPSPRTVCYTFGDTVDWFYLPTT